MLGADAAGGGFSLPLTARAATKELSGEGSAPDQFRVTSGF
jgi:hypothetical protein